MKFEETYSEIKTFTREYYDSIIYFLLQDDEVVYVGQSKGGLARPFSHCVDKDFNLVKNI